MMKSSARVFLGILALAGVIGGCNESPPSATTDAAPAATANTPGSADPVGFAPPAEGEIPETEVGEAILLGRNIFVNTQRYAKEFVGNGLNCANCHLNNGRKADSAPLWAAYGVYPAFRQKTGQIDTIQSRIQGCFRYSMDGTPPGFESREMTALVTYHHWLATGAPIGVTLPGRGYPEVGAPALAPDLARGREIYRDNCELCHSANGEGTRAHGEYAFPPLWGMDSFNWGAGMHRINTAAGFIKANMPYGLGGTLSDQDAWDVALFMNSHDRPEDPRFQGSVAQTRDEYHDEICLYGRTVEELEAILEDQAAE